ncbi:sigma-70 family RNA polymerase sigma factor [Allorhizobium sp. BGMRC 0089]|uniref:sigma-70 family RNA polymerase sigma factor n=1 Tax=Allorhizobium sonneratiae TaxID=2934936 RepID=UPI0020348FCF|nr:sigma-70 family RNA polymerase sigma factor [Allorhizobium sonneratiae]MCM2292674.1 sigma-70 family RNA polymerase sigma factor [Allorhizobium sonneratiae]
MDSHAAHSRASLHADIVALIPALKAFAQTFCRNRTDVDDLVQETLAKALANIDKFEPGTRLKSWMFTIMRNTFYTRAKTSHREGPSPVDGVADGLRQEATQDWSVQGQELLHAMNVLPAHYRDVLILVIVQGESYSHAADVCDCAIGTVKSRLNRARHLLLEELDHTM